LVHETKQYRASLTKASAVSAKEVAHATNRVEYSAAPAIKDERIVIGIPTKELPTDARQRQADAIVGGKKRAAPQAR
jgi:hypothetical protein